MFAEVKESLPISGNGYDGAIITQIRAAVLDLTSSTEIVLDGVVDIERDAETGIVTDNSTIVDELVITAVSVWCNMRIGNPPNYDKLLEAYNSLKGQMRMSSRYNGGGGTCEN